MQKTDKVVHTASNAPQAEGGENGNHGLLSAIGTGIKIAGIVKNSIVDGPGIRYAIFAQGCPHKCEGCHNPHTHDFDGGREVDIRQIAAEVRNDPLLDGLTFTGGEPFAQVRAFAELAKLLEGYHIYCYTGYTFEELYSDPDAHILLNCVDVLVDGRFIQSQRSFKTAFKGSENQRVIDLKESLKRGKAIEMPLH